VATRACRPSSLTVLESEAEAVVCVTGGRGQSGAGGKLALTPYNQDRVRVLMVRFVADDVRKV
jgi:hypothetical protein